MDFEQFKNRFDAIVIGASAGGIETLKEILQSLTNPYPVPIIIAQHIGDSGRQSISKFFGEIFNLSVQEVEDKMPIESGVIYFAPPNYHVLIESDKTFSLSVEDPVSHARPSIDVLFSSAAQVYKNKLLGIVLTGANHDGADGLKDIKDAGGTTIAEDPASAKVPTMPIAAIERASPHLILNTKSIEKLVSFLK